MTITEREAREFGIDVENLPTDEEEGAEGCEATTTTLAIFCEVFGWQGGTIHQARERAAVASLDELDRLAGELSRRIRQISDPREALWFMKHRTRAHGLHVIGVSE